MSDVRACNCIGPQNGEPLCPCMMRNVSKRDGHWIKDEEDLGPVRPKFPDRAPMRHRAGFGCICPPTSEKTCENSECPRKRKGSLHDRIGP